MNTFKFVRCLKNDVRVCSMKKSVNLVMVVIRSSLMFILSKPKIGCLSPIFKGQTHLCLLDVPKMMFEFV